jgi:membrane fusion protein (multidrug efflux system)
VGLLVLPACGGDDERQIGGGGRSDTLLVTVAPVKMERLEDQFRTTGQLLADEEVELRAEVSGRVVRLPFQEGAFVRQGQLLAALDTEVLQAELRAAQTRRDLASVQAGRQRELFGIGGLSRQALDQAEAELQVLEADLARIRAEIERRRIYAPFSGTVGLRAVSPGAYVSPGDRLATLRVTDPLKLEFGVPERYLGRVSPGDRVRFSVPGGDGPYFAEVYAVEPGVAASTRAFTVRARMPNPGAALQPGGFAEVELVFDAVDDALLVPASAVVPGAGRPSVWLAQDGVAVPREVTTGVRTADEVQITDGVSPGEIVLTSGFETIRPQMPIRTGDTAFDPAAVRAETERDEEGSYRTTSTSTDR